MAVAPPPADPTSDWPVHLDPVPPRAAPAGEPAPTGEYAYALRVRRHRRDEALGFVAVDLGGRPYCVVDAAFATPRVGQLGTDLIAHLFESIAIHGRLNLHARILYGHNDHHKVEALFKAFGRALDAATRIDERLGGAVPSTKGTL